MLSGHQQTTRPTMEESTAPPPPKSYWTKLQLLEEPGLRVSLLMRSSLCVARSSSAGVGRQSPVAFAVIWAVCCRPMRGCRRHESPYVVHTNRDQRSVCSCAVVAAGVTDEMCQKRYNVGSFALKATRAATAPCAFDGDGWWTAESIRKNLTWKLVHSSSYSV